MFAILTNQIWVGVPQMHLCVMETKEWNNQKIGNGEKSVAGCQNNHFYIVDCNERFWHETKSQSN